MYLSPLKRRLLIAIRAYGFSYRNFEMQPLKLLATCFCQLTSLSESSVLRFCLVWYTHKLEKLFHFRHLETDAPDPRRDLRGCRTGAKA